MAEVYLNEREFSVRFIIPKRTAERWRSSGDGPSYVRLDPRRIAYRLTLPGQKRIIPL